MNEPEVSAERLFANLKLIDAHQDVFRNIVSIHSSQDLFDDLTSSPAEWALAQQVEDQTKPPTYQSRTPILHRPFEDAQWFNAIGWPFKHWQASRYSDGAFGVWYGSESIETTVYETAYHWVTGLLRDANFDAEHSGPVVIERKLFDVRCDAALLDLRGQAKRHKALTHKTDYTTTQAIGARLHREGHPGLLALSARRTNGENYAIFNADVLSAPRANCQLTYRLQGDAVFVEKMPGEAWLQIGLEELV